MVKVGILPNIEKDKDLAVTKRLLRHLLDRGCMPQLTEDVAQLADLEMYARKEEELFQYSDFLISLGGDGTLLGVGRKSARYDTPILGINLGTLGFLTAEEKNKAEFAIDKVLAGKYTTEKRMLLETTFQTAQQTQEHILALNDICVTRGLLYKILEFRIYINGEYVDTLRADGVVVCTPTGSTAYNLSAGGPVLKADAQIIAITPIAAHTLTSRSIVVSADDVVTLEINPREETAFTVSADGQEGWSLSGKTTIHIEKARVFASIMKTNTQSFYDVLRHKLVR